MQEVAGCFLGCNDKSVHGVLRLAPDSKYKCLHVRVCCQSVRFCNLIDWSLYGRDFVHTCLWHGPLNSTKCLFVYGRAVQVLLTVQYTWTHIMWVLIM